MQEIISKTEVDPKFYGLIAGLKFVTTKKIEQDTGTRITIPKQPDGNLTIHGTADGIAKAKEAILTIIKESQTKPKVTPPAFSKTLIDVNRLKILAGQSDKEIAKQMDVGPELEYPRSFSFHPNESKNLAAASAVLLTTAPTWLSQAMRLEFLSTGSDWKLTLRLDPIQWFDEYTRLETGQESELPRIARTYVDQQRVLIHNTREIREEQIPTVISKEYCDYGSSCDRRPSCKKEHATICCEIEVDRRGGAHPRRCGWQLSEELCIDKENYFLLLGRPEPCRDFLMVPHPKVLDPQKLWVMHYSNKQLCCMPFFWDMMFTKVDLLAKKANLPHQQILDKVALNFGLWETESSLDHRAIDCHGHAHLELTVVAANALSKEFQVLEGRMNKPEDYRDINCTALESKRLVAREIGALRNQMDTLTTEVGTLSSRVDTLSSQMDTLSSRVDTLSSRVDKIDDKMDIVLGKLDKLLSKPD